MKRRTVYLVAAGAGAVPIVWTIAASVLFVVLAQRQDEFPWPLTTWWLYVSWWSYNTLWTNFLVVVSGLVPAAGIALLGVAIVQIYMRRKSATPLYGSAEWASKEHSKTRGFSFSKRV